MAVSEQTSEAPRRPDPPPLRIHHLMACAAVAAIQLSLWRAVFPDAAQRMSVPSAVVTAISYGLSAVGLTLALMSIYWHFKGYAGLVQPGQWLLLSYGIYAIGFYVSVALALDYFAAAALHYLLPVAFFGWCAWKLADSLPWRIVFAVSALTWLVTSPMVLYMVHGPIGYSNMALLLPRIGRASAVLLFEIWAAVDDRLSGRRRYWTHWSGLFFSMISQLLSIAGGVVYWFELS